MVPKSKYVVFPIDKKRFALPAESVTELARPDHMQAFPHTTPWVAGVLLRRGRIIPVLDVAQVIFATDAPKGKFYLIANRQFGSETEWTAVPVTGECELMSADMVRPAGRLPDYVIGLLSLENEIIEVLNLDKIAAMGSVA